MSATATDAPATAPQIDFLRKLDTEFRDRMIAHYEATGDTERAETFRSIADAVEESYQTVTKRAASARIDMMKGRVAEARALAPKTVPAAPKPATGDVDVPAGHYAIKVTEDANDTNPEHDIRFYRVDRPEKGKWAGWTFVKVQSSDEWYRVGRDESKRVLAAIAADVETARMRYADETTRCTRCNRALTDATSRQTGMGPECRSK